mmetsp:Transcript_155984/g.500171  ORF Transcript_155984/g.500171 Transcript_155984/m.500171 type:complete len:228 (-) Transcript_155984:3590-4273(-)
MGVLAGLPLALRATAGTLARALPRGDAGGAALRTSADVVAPTASTSPLVDGRRGRRWQLLEGHRRRRRQLLHSLRRRRGRRDLCRRRPRRRRHGDAPRRVVASVEEAQAAFRGRIGPALGQEGLLVEALPRNVPGLFRLGVREAPRHQVLFELCKGPPTASQLHLQVGQLLQHLLEALPPELRDRERRPREGLLMIVQDLGSRLEEAQETFALARGVQVLLAGQVLG